jgi:hypothetical protein
MYFILIAPARSIYTHFGHRGLEMLINKFDKSRYKAHSDGARWPNLRSVVISTGATARYYLLYFCLLSSGYKYNLQSRHTRVLLVLDREISPRLQLSL